MRYLLIYGSADNYTDMSFMENYFTTNFYLKTKNNYISNSEIKNFLEEYNLEDSSYIYIIWSELVFNFNKNLEEILNSVENNINKDKFCYLINYMEDCKNLKILNKNENFSFNKAESVKNIYAGASSVSFFKSKISKKSVDAPIYLRLEKEESIFLWPPLFSFSLETLKDYPYLSNICRNNVQKNIIKRKSNNISFYFFLLTIFICFAIYYQYTKDLPKDRFFNIKSVSKRFSVKG